MSRRMRTLSKGSCVLALLAVLPATGTSQDFDVNRLSEIRRAVIRDMAEPWMAFESVECIAIAISSGRTDRPDSLWAAVLKDPTPELLLRLEDLAKPVVPLSECAIDFGHPPAPGPGRLIHTGTGRRAIRIHVGRIIQDEEAGQIQVHASYWYHGRAAGGYVYWLEMTEGGWTIVHRKRYWVS